MAVRLYVLIARNSSRAVVFRRGPGKRVQLVSWDTAADVFERGQWLRGRIYERRCDLSPDGELLLYFAASWRPPYDSWSAISRPPYLTALALWPKGNAWGGGGAFDSDTHVLLNHTEPQSQLADGFTLPKWLTVAPFGEHSGWGEDLPVWESRLLRDGWRVLHEGWPTINRLREAKIWITYDPMRIIEKPHPSASLRLRMILRGVKERQGRPYVIDHAVVREEGEDVALLRDTDWADWCANGDLLFARGASLYRLPFADGTLMPADEARELIDFSNDVFEPRQSPLSARRWPAR